MRLAAGLLNTIKVKAVYFTTAGLLLYWKKLAYATRNLGYVQFIVRTDHMMRLSCLPEQLARSSEQLVLMDTKGGFIRP